MTLRQVWNAQRYVLNNQHRHALETGEVPKVQSNGLDLFASGWWHPDWRNTLGRTPFIDGEIPVDPPSCWKLTTGVRRYGALPSPLPPPGLPHESGNHPHSGAHSESCP